MRSFLLALFFLFSGMAYAQGTFVVVSKQELLLRVFGHNGELILSFPVSCGTNYGNKAKAGDNRTPEGIFKIITIEPSEKWTWDFDDGNGIIEGAYGPLFFRLDAPGFQGIGLHGTHDPSTVPGRNTSGCVRMKNEDLLEFAKVVKRGTIVVITSSPEDGVATKKIEDNFFASGRY